MATQNRTLVNSYQITLFAQQPNEEYYVRQIEWYETKWMILNVHYAKRMPQISYAFGLFKNNFLVGVCTYGKPASPKICKHICGAHNKKNVYELNRLALMYNGKNEASMLIGRSLRLLPAGLIIVSYSDTDQDHIGYVYQATNWLYTGLTKQRTDMIGVDGKHARHYKKGETKRVKRSAKHRYVTFTGSKLQKKQLRKELTYDTYEYPKST